jgi:hypothetical protein
MDVVNRDDRLPIRRLFAAELPCPITASTNGHPACHLNEYRSANEKWGTHGGPSLDDLHLSDLRIPHRYLPPGCPEVNGTVERSHPKSIGDLS